MELLPQTKKTFLWYGVGIGVRIAATAPFLQRIAEAPSKDLFAGYFVFLLLAAPIIAWAYAVSFLIQLLIIDGIKPLKFTASTALLIFLLSPFSYYGTLSLLYPGMALGMVGFAIATKGSIFGLLGFAWMFIGTPLLVAALFGLFLSVVLGVALRLPSDERRQMRWIGLRGAVTAAALLGLSPLLSALLPNEYGRWLVALLAVVIPFIPHQIWVWQAIRERVPIAFSNMSEVAFFGRNVRIPKYAATGIAATAIVVMNVLAFDLYGVATNPTKKLALPLSGLRRLPVDPVPVEMGSLAFSIPRSYFTSLYTPDETKEEREISLQVLLPNFEPRTPANSKEFDRGGWHNQIRMLISYKRPLRRMPDLFNSSYTSQYRSSVQDFEFGYKGFKNLGFDNLFKGSESAPTDFIQCSPIMEGRSPSCQRYIWISPDVHIQYSLSRDHLEHVGEIEDRIIELLSQFQRRGPALARME